MSEALDKEISHYIEHCKRLGISLDEILVGFVEKLKKERDQAHNSALELAITAVPTTWLSDLLSGPNQIGNGPPYTGPDIERLMLAIYKRIKKLKRPA